VTTTRARYEQHVRGPKNFLLLFGALSISSLLQKSPAFDEPAHFLSGYS